MIYTEITDEYHFWDWIKHSDSYGNNFSLEGAKAVQEWFEEYSDSTGENVSFDPIAWCVEFTEYDSVGEAYAEHFGNYDDVEDQTQGNRTPEQQLERFQDNTTVIELDNGHIILGEF